MGTLIRTFTSAVFLSALVAACSSSDDDAPVPAGNGVNDVKKACEIRVAWKGGPGTTRCAYCMAAVMSPPCACSEQKPFAGACETQQSARSKESTACEGVDSCRSACPIGDCACIDACYAGKDTCRKVTAAVEGCVAEVCTDECNAE